MQRGDKAPEPSMEEILASIRKIIAEEPIGSRPGPGPGEQALRPSAFPRTFPRRDGPDPETPASPAAQPGASRAPFSLDDPLADLIDDRPPGHLHADPNDALSPKPGSPEPAASAGKEVRQRPSWLFSRSNSVPAPPAVGPTGTPVQGGTHAGQSGPSRRDGARPAAPETLAESKPFSAAPVVKAPASEPARQPQPAPRAPEPAPAASAPLAKRSDEAPAAAPAAAVNVQRPHHGEPASASQPLNGALPQPDSAPQRPASQAVPAAAASSAPSPQPSARALPRDNVADETDSAPDLEAALQAAISPKPAVSPAARPDVAPSPAVSALDALAQGLTAARVTAKRPVEPEPEQKAAPTGSLAEAPKMPGPAAELPATPQKVASEPASPAQEGAVPSPSVIAGLRTLEDTVADLLRPMLRDWLDANMPRIVEKALRVETAKDIRPTSAPKDQK